MKKLLFGIFLLPALVLPAPAQAASCKDFSTQQEAQAYFNRNGGGNLDRNKDGVACESLPGGSSGFSAPAPAETQQTNSQPEPPRCAASVPKVADPWKLPKAVLMGNAKASYYYKGVVLAGDSRYVSDFLDCYNLTTKFRSNYSSVRPIWAACIEVGQAGDGGQTVCVAVDRNGEAADDRIFSAEYAETVAETVGL